MRGCRSARRDRGSTRGSWGSAPAGRRSAPAPRPGALRCGSFGTSPWACAWPCPVRSRRTRRRRTAPLPGHSPAGQPRARPGSGGHAPAGPRRAQRGCPRGQPSSPLRRPGTRSPDGTGVGFNPLSTYPSSPLAPLRPPALPTGRPPPASAAVGKRRGLTGDALPLPQPLHSQRSPQPPGPTQGAEPTILTQSPMAEKRLYGCRNWRHGEMRQTSAHVSKALLGSSAALAPWSPQALGGQIA